MNKPNSIHLKSYVCYIPDETSSELHNVAKECYLKSEADKKIALYKRGWEESDTINARIYAELRKQKYKRCLSMAALWSDRIETSTDAENELVALRRYNKWTELAKKFKESK